MYRTSTEIYAQCPKSPIFQLLQTRSTGSETKMEFFKSDGQLGKR